MDAAHNYLNPATVDVNEFFGGKKKVVPTRTKTRSPPRRKVREKPITPPKIIISRQESSEHMEDLTDANE